MIQPPFLKKNDTVAIVATARKITLDEIKPAIHLLKQWGLNVKVGNTIGLSEHQFAGSDEARRKDFQKMLDDDNVKAIWCARGGYGTVRIIDSINFEKFIENPKWIIGYSDVTVLHSHLHNLDVQSLHATMPINVAENTSEALISLKNVLFGKTLAYTIQSSKKNKIGTAQGHLVGGNLSMLYSLIGSKTCISTKDKILFIEDLDEYLYHIDRMLINLKRNGYFENITGLIVGGMTDMNDNAIPFGKTAEEIILDVLADYKFPIAFSFPAGHLKDNRALVLGSEVKIKVKEDKTNLSF
ncbi:MAG TPA: LD-carboxypeptidase [Flavobacteriaceae bacterium]|nr:LD-carboxypeptidase [Flavobacteriaceae bacterium]